MTLGGKILIAAIFGLSGIAWFLLALRYLRYKSEQLLEAADITWCLTSEQNEKAASKSQWLLGIKSYSITNCSLAARIVRGIISYWEGMGEIPAQRFNSLVFSETLAMRSFSGIITASGSIMMLLGLLGTVLGIMTTFEGLSLGTDQINHSSLSGGISSALLTTQAGLLAAIPVMLANGILSSRVRRIIHSALQHAKRVKNTLEEEDSND